MKKVEEQDDMDMYAIHFCSNLRSKERVNEEAKKRDQKFKQGGDVSYNAFRNKSSLLCTFRNDRLYRKNRNFHKVGMKSAYFYETQSTPN